MRRKITNLFNSTLDYTSALSNNISNISNWNYLLNPNLNWWNKYDPCMLGDFKFNSPFIHNIADDQRQLSVLRSVSHNNDISNDEPIGGQEATQKGEEIEPAITIGGDFKSLITKSTTYVDKSLFIKEIFEDPSEVILITMPRRWGKSLNLDMLRRFLSIDHTEKDINKQIFTSNKAKILADGTRTSLNITEPTFKIVDKNDIFSLKKEISPKDIQGSYPVIYIDFKNCKGTNVEEIKGKIKNILQKSFSNHSYLENSTKLTKEEKQEFAIYRGEQSCENLTDKQIHKGIQYLSGLLCKHHNQKVWILIDEYDAAANKAYLEFDENEAKQVSELFRSIYEPALKGNEALEKGVMTGVQYIVKSGMLSGLNNLSKYNIMDSKYAKYYGINQEEMEHLLAGFKINPGSQIAKEIKNWYNGYKEKNDEGEYIDKYNIWSVVNFLNNQKAGYKSYWEKSGSVSDFLDYLFKDNKLKNDLENLVNGHAIGIGEPETDFSIDNFRTLKKMKDNIGIIKLDLEGINLFYSYLFITGYMTLEENKVSLPNKEIVKEMSNYLKNYYLHIFRISTDEFTQVTDILSKILEEDNIKKMKLIFMDEFAPKFQSIISQLDKDTAFMNEDMVHSLLNNIAIQVVNAQFATERYTTKPDKTKGRADIVLAKNNKGIVIEMKYNKSSTDSNEDLYKDQAKDALKQAKSYGELVKDEDIQIFVGCNITDEQKVYLAGEISSENETIIFDNW